MLRVLFYLVIVAALGFGFAWLADRPGELDVTFAGNHYNVPLITAVAGIVAIVAAILILWWLIKSIIQSPTHCAGIFARASVIVAISRCQPD